MDTQSPSLQPCPPGSQAQAGPSLICLFKTLVSACGGGPRSPCVLMGAHVRFWPPLTACPLPDIDKVMINLKTEEFVLDMNTLQALQQLLQWVGDFVLYLLASLPNQVRLHSYLGAPPPRSPAPGLVL